MNRDELMQELLNLYAAKTRKDINKLFAQATALQLELTRTFPDFDSEELKPLKKLLVDDDLRELVCVFIESLDELKAKAQRML